MDPQKLYKLQKLWNLKIVQEISYTRAYFSSLGKVFQRIFEIMYDIFKIVFLEKIEGNLQGIVFPVYKAADDMIW